MRDNYPRVDSCPNVHSCNDRGCTGECRRPRAAPAVQLHRCPTPIYCSEQQMGCKGECKRQSAVSWGRKQDDLEDELLMTAGRRLLVA